MSAWMWNLAGKVAMRTGTALHDSGLALCGIAGYLDARADEAGYWTPARRDRLQRRVDASHFEIDWPTS